MKVAILTFITPNLEYGDISRANLERYCSAHGYEPVIYDRLPRPDVVCHWNKVPALQEVLPQFDAVLWKDADSVFVPGAASLDHLLGYGACGSESVRGLDRINGGHLLFRNIPENIAMLEAMLAMPYALKDEGTHEQQALNELRWAGKAPHFKRLPQCVFNAFCFYKWKSGFYVDERRPETITVHWPGRAKHASWIDMMAGVSDGQL